MISSMTRGATSTPVGFRFQPITRLDRTHQRFQLGDSFRKLGGQVYPFAQVGFEIVKFVDFLPIVFNGVAVEVGVGLQVFPFALTNAGIPKIEMLAPAVTNQARKRDRFHGSHGIRTARREGAG